LKKFVNWQSKPKGRETKLKPISVDVELHELLALLLVIPNAGAGTDLCVALGQVHQLVTNVEHLISF
jgi:hypothetical protein